MHTGLLQSRCCCASPGGGAYAPPCPWSIAGSSLCHAANSVCPKAVAASSDHLLPLTINHNHRYLGRFQAGALAMHSRQQGGFLCGRHCALRLHESPTSLRRAGIVSQKRTCQAMSCCLVMGAAQWDMAPLGHKPLSKPRLGPQLVKKARRSRSRSSQALPG